MPARCCFCNDHVAQDEFDHNMVARNYTRTPGIPHLIRVRELDYFLLVQKDVYIFIRSWEDTGYEYRMGRCDTCARIHEIIEGAVSVAN